MKIVFIVLGIIIVIVLAATGLWLEFFLLGVLAGTIKLALVMQKRRKEQAKIDQKAQKAISAWLQGNYRFPDAV
ncbi:MAG: hypothetical protein FWG66_00720 [Spirochaetes bacterium]|nr:hypothetical protein [Spirochaetota bacterium]